VFDGFKRPAAETRRELRGKLFVPFNQGDTSGRPTDSHGRDHLQSIDNYFELEVVLHFHTSCVDTISDSVPQTICQSDLGRARCLAASGRPHQNPFSSTAAQLSRTSSSSRYTRDVAGAPDATKRRVASGGPASSVTQGYARGVKHVTYL
jgi:hypothetical protein